MDENMKGARGNCLKRRKTQCTSDITSHFFPNSLANSWNLTCWISRQSMYLAWMHSRTAYLGLGITGRASSWTSSVKPQAMLGSCLTERPHMVNRKGSWWLSSMYSASSTVGTLERITQRVALPISLPFAPLLCTFDSQGCQFTPKHGGSLRISLPAFLQEGTPITRGS